MKNSTDPLVAKLASWTPRPPSAELERRLFGESSTARRTTPTGAAPREVAATAHWLAWLAPVFGTALLVGSSALHTTAPAGLHAGDTNAPWFAALDSAAAQSAQNALPVAGFAWTSARPPSSTNASFRGLN